MNGSITSLLLVPGPAPAKARPGPYPAPETRGPEPDFRRHLSAALAAPAARPADRRADPPRAGDTGSLRRQDPADDASRADRLPDPKAAQAARTHSHGRPAGQTGRAGAPNQPAGGDPAADSDDEAATIATGDTPPAQAGPHATPPGSDGVTGGILPVPRQPAGAPDSAAPGAGSAAAQAADAARAAGVPVAPAVLAAVLPGGSPHGRLPADAAAFGARMLQELATAASADEAADGATPQPPGTVPGEPTAPFRIPGAPAWAAGGNPGNPGDPGAPGSQSGTPDGQGGAGTAAGPNQPAAGPSLADLIQLVHQSATRLDEPAAAPSTDSLPPHLSPAAAAAAPAPASAAFPADLSAPARPAVQVDPRLVAEQVATAARRVSLAVSGDRSELRVRLWPRELGELHLKLVMENGALRADIVVARPEVKAALDAGLSDLRQRLEQQGLHVESFQVALGSGDAGRHSRQGTAPEFYGRSQRRVPIRPLDLDDGAAPGPVADLAIGGFGPRGRHLNGWA